MTRPCLATLLLLLLTIAAQARKGVGCWRGKPSAGRTAMARQRADMGQLNPFVGQKRGLVILAEFPDTKFKTGHDSEKYQQILNTPGYTTDEGFRGSVADYFRDQSAGQFELVFDVLGPYTAAHNVKYYGENDAAGDDLRPQELIKEVCLAADAEVDFSDYDWNQDGEVDEVFVLYAGKAEVDTYKQEDLIWPHMWTLEESLGEPLSLDGVTINIYACANEIRNNGKITGIGTICHEFSHCMGLPDFYDIGYNGSYGMGDYDLMDSGCYLGNEFCPVGYTAYEKMACGWQQPIVLGSDDVAVEHLKPMSEQGDTYIIYNDAHPDEYYMIENRQKSGWDSYYPAAGLMITHVDFDWEVWQNNIPNSVMTLKEARELGITCTNDHERMTFFHANNSKNSPRLYPYLGRDSLTATSLPAATLYNANSAGTKLMQSSIRDISQNSDGTVSFTFQAGRGPVADAIATVAADSQQPVAAYDLTGRRVTGPRRGVYIVGGRKVAW